MPQATTLCKTVRAQHGTRTKNPHAMMLRDKKSYSRRKLRHRGKQFAPTRHQGNTSYVSHERRHRVKQLLRNTPPGQGAQESNSYFINKRKKLLMPQATTVCKATRTQLGMRTGPRKLSWTHLIATENRRLRHC